MPRSRKIPLVQQNSLESCDVFLSLFNSFVGASPIDIVLLNDTLSRKAFLPSFTGFKAFASPVPRPRVVIYVSWSFLFFYTSLHEFSWTTEEVMHQDVYRPYGCFPPMPRKFPSQMCTPGPWILRPSLAPPKTRSTNWTSHAGWMRTSTSITTLPTPSGLSPVLERRPRPLPFTGPRTLDTPFSIALGSTLGFRWKDSTDPVSLTWLLRNRSCSLPVFHGTPSPPPRQGPITSLSESPSPLPPTTEPPHALCGTSLTGEN